MNKLIGVPCNLGANKCGIDFGIPELLKYSPRIFKDMSILGIQHQEEDFSNQKMKYKNTILHTCQDLSEITNHAIKDGDRPIIIGGDHSLGLGSIAGVAVEKDNLGVIWIDAHADMNTADISESGHIHGMPLAFLLGHGDKDFINVLKAGAKIQVKNAIVIGTRDLDVEEEAFMNEIGLKYIPYDVIKNQGLDITLDQIRSYLQVEELHISFDVDSMDPSLAPGVSTPVSGGFSYENVIDIFDFLNHEYKVSSIDIVEFNPVNDKEQKTLRIVNNLVDWIQENID